jgi:hypothetical protein
VNLFGQLPVLAEQNFRLPCRHIALLKRTDYGPWFDNHKRLRELVAELEEISLAIAEADPAGTANQARPAQAPGHATGTNASRLRGLSPLNLWPTLHRVLACPCCPN